MVRLENDHLKVDIAPLGAELQSLFSKQHSLQYLWNGDPAHWGKHAPVLFPIVGQLKDNTYIYNGKAYGLNRHGFAREMEFKVVQAADTSAIFSIESNEDTRQLYPFEFELRLNYLLEGPSLITGYEVSNKGNEPMYFSIGAHPAFTVPLSKSTRYEDYYLEFNQKETASKWPLHSGLIGSQPQGCLDDSNHLRLTHELFYEDALVFKKLHSTSVSIKSETTSHGLKVDFQGFPYLGIWAAEDAPFVCIEPWCGLADSVYHNQQLKEKEGIIELGANATWVKDWKITCF
jgi:galactose mutarotase-like enzyme